MPDILNLEDFMNMPEIKELCCNNPKFRKIIGSNPHFRKALNNDIFKKCILEIGKLPYKLDPIDKRKKGSHEQMKIIRFEYNTEKGEKSIIWLYFPQSSTSKSIQCRLQKYSYNDEKVKAPKSSDNRGYPEIFIHNENEIMNLISCINMYMSNVLKISVNTKFYK